MTTLSINDLKPGKAARVEVNGVAVCVARVGDEVFAVADTCSHSDASLSEGDVTDHKIECLRNSFTFGTIRMVVF